MKNIYTSLAGFYDLGLTLNGYRAASRHIVEQLPFPDNVGLHVLDVGAGTGLYSFAIHDRFTNARIDAFDLNADMISAMKRRIEEGRFHDVIQAFVGDMDAVLPFAQPPYDLIVSGGVLEYASSMPATIRKLSMHLKPGGLWLNSPVKKNIPGQLIGSMFDFTPKTKDENMEAFTRNGFELIEARTLPSKFLLMTHLKEWHLFKKITV